MGQGQGSCIGYCQLYSRLEYLCVPSSDADQLIMNTKLYSCSQHASGYGMQHCAIPGHANSIYHLCGCVCG